MHFDALTLACIAQELRSSLLGGRVQQALLPDEHSVGLEVYAQSRRSYLLLSAHYRKQLNCTRDSLRAAHEASAGLMRQAAPHASTMPRTVPSRPSKGAIAAIVSRAIRPCSRERVS